MRSVNVGWTKRIARAHPYLKWWACHALPTLLLLLTSCVSSNNSSTLTDRPDVKQFIQYMVSEYHFDQAALETTFSQARINPDILAKIQAPYEAKPWYIYEQHLVTEKRIQAGIAFWQAHQNALNKAEKIYGVPPEIIVAIMGIETNYGANQGSYPVLDTLSTLTFAYPKRSQYFRKELIQYLLLCREHHWDPSKILGSYAGAMGQSQFMPSYYRNYAVDFSGSGNIDLFHNATDVIGSTANYLHAYGWQPNAPFAMPARIVGRQDLQSLTDSFKLTSLSQLAQYGIYPTRQIAKKQSAILMQLEIAPNQLQYWLGFKNFYVITRYNASQNYALAVQTLADKINNQMQISIDQAPRH